MIDHTQKEMCTMGTLISPIALLAESQATLEPHAL